jgi:L-fuconate dehydratase
MAEHAGHLHEHFLDPIRVENGHYRAPTRPGFSAEMRPQSIADHRFPSGSIWSGGPVAHAAGQLSVRRA